MCESQEPKEIGTGNNGYRAYSHYSAILDRTGKDWLLAMFEVYFDDSGTDRKSEIAVAACYISTKRGWDEFKNEWDLARWEEGFETFHMAEFVAKPDQKHKPFCDWDNPKKDRIYGRLARIINRNKLTGIAVAVPKQLYDKTSERFRAHNGEEHYTFAVRTCLKGIAAWRRESGRQRLPMQYFFDWETPGSRKRREIESIWEGMHEVVFQELGTDHDGCSFQHKEVFKPLQAADVLAWQMKTHMEKILPFGEDRPELTHPGFIQLREDQEMPLAFFTENQLKGYVNAFEEATAKGFTVID